MTADARRWAIVLVVATVAIGGVAFSYADARPCVHPVTYAIGAIDARFSLATSSLIALAAASATIWNTAEGKTVLAYDPSAALKINLVYDAREANAKIGAEIVKEQADMNAARDALATLHAQFAERQASYNQDVAAVNARGGATRSEQISLAAERDALKNFGDSVNAQIAGYNADVQTFNASVASYNQTAGKEFKEGEFIRDSSGERIDIYEFIGSDQLERVLAHEEGHALGLDHNSNPDSIMYAENESGNVKPTSDDLSALHSLCGS